MLAAVSLLLSCAGEPPALYSAQISHLALVSPENGAITFSILAALGVDDPDGLGDLVEVYVINDGARLHWSLEPGTWRETELPGGPGIVLPPLALPEAGPAPAGRYRILVIDAGGRSAEQEVTLRRLREPVALPDALIDLRPAELRTDNLPSSQLLLHSDGGRTVNAVASESLSGAEISLLFPDPDRDLVVQWGPLRLPAD